MQHKRIASYESFRYFWMNSMNSGKSSPSLHPGSYATWQARPIARNTNRPATGYMGTSNWCVRLANNDANAMQRPSWFSTRSAWTCGKRP